MAKLLIHTGGCLCGNIRFAAKGEALKPHTCSCTMCQHHTGSLTAAWVEFARDDVSWTGPSGEPSKYKSSEWSSRAFCAKCGSSIGAIDEKPVVALLLGTFDKPKAKALAPEYHSYVTPRPKWWHIEIRD